MKRRKKAKRLQSAIAKIALVAAVAPLIATTTHRLSGSTLQLAWQIPGYDLSSKFEGGIESGSRAAHLPSDLNPPQAQNSARLSTATNPTLRAKWIIHVPQIAQDTPTAPPLTQQPLPKSGDGRAPQAMPAQAPLPKQNGHTYAIEVSQTIGFSAREVKSPP